MLLRKLLFPALLFLCTQVFGQATGKVVLQAEVMPHWQGCEDAADKLDCTRSKLNAYLKENMRYPSAAKAAKLEGTVILSMVIDTKGKVLQPNVVYDPGKGCAEEALRLVKTMPDWVPGTDKGEAVNVIYNLEVPFILDADSEEITEMTQPVDEPERLNISDAFVSKPKEEKTEVSVKEQPASPKETTASVKEVKPELNIEKEETLPVQFEEQGGGRLYTRAEVMPYFKGCESEMNGSEGKRKCAERRLIDYLSSQINYPEQAKTAKTEGLVFINFIIDERGNITSPKIIRDIGNGCGAEALRVVSGMPAWEPGTDSGLPVRVKMNLPVRFNISSGASAAYKIHWGALKDQRIPVDQLYRAVSEQLVVRDRYGDDVIISGLNVAYEKNLTLREENSSGDMTLDMKRLIRKAKPGGLLTLTATIQEGPEMVEVFRTFEVIR